MKKILIAFSLLIVVFFGGIIIFSFDYIISHWVILLAMWILFCCAVFYPHFGNLFRIPKFDDDEITEKFDEMLQKKEK